MMQKTGGQHNFVSRKGSVIYSLLGLALGLILLVLPLGTVRLLSAVCGLLAVGWGALRLIRAAVGWVSGVPYPGILAGLLALIFGFYLIDHPGNVLSLLPTAAGIFLLYAGIERVAAALRSAPQTVSLTARMGISGIIGLLLCLAGLALVLFPMHAVTSVLRIVGVFVILANAGDLIRRFRSPASSASASASDGRKPFSGAASRADSPSAGYIRRAPDGAYEAEYRDITDETDRSDNS